jgi:hypothetical protein
MNRSADASRRTIRFLFGIDLQHASFGARLPSSRLAAFNKTGPDLATSENVAKLRIFFEGPNIRR